MDPMAMSSTELRPLVVLAAALGLGALSGCASAPTPSPSAVRANAALQLAGPEARDRTSDGARAVLAQERYRAGRVTPPVAEGAAKSGGGTTPP